MCNRHNVWPKLSHIVSSVLCIVRIVKYMEAARKQMVALYEYVRFPQFHVNGTDNCCCSIIISEATHRRTERERASFFHHHPYPACQVFLQALTPNGDLKFCIDVINNMLPVFIYAYQSKIQEGQGRYSRDLPKGNQQRAMEYHKVHIQYLLHWTGCS